MMALRSMAMDIARRTRTSLKGALSVRIEMWLITGVVNSSVWSRGRFCLSTSLICTQSTRLMMPMNSQPRSYLPDDEGGHAGGIVLVDEDLDPVDMGEPGQEVARIAHEGEPDIGPVRVEHPGPGADGRLVALEVAELVHALAGDDGHRVRVGEHVQEPDVGLLQGDLDGVLVGRLHLVHRGQHVGVGIALDRAEAIDGVDDVLGGELAPVHRGLVMPPHALAELEDVCRLVGLAPRLGQIALDREGAWGHAGAGAVLEEPAMREGVRDMGLVRDGQVRIPVGRVPGPDIDGAATLWASGRGRVRR